MNEHSCNVEYEKKLAVIEKTVNTHDTRINNHSDRLDVLEKNESRNDEKIQNLIDKMDSLITTIRWGTGLFMGGIVGFFFYAIQHNIFK